MWIDVLAGQVIWVSSSTAAVEVGESKATNKSFKGCVLSLSKGMLS
jgi:hypothetical protein